MDIAYVENGEFLVVVFDATLREQYTHSATVKQHPVAEGSNVTDDTRPDADLFTAEVHVSNTPVISPNVDGANGQVRSYETDTAQRVLTKGATVSQAGEVTEAEYDYATQRVGFSVLQFEDQFDRVRAVYTTVQRLNAQGIECTITAGLRTWDSMQIARVSALKTAQSGSGLSFTFDFSEVRFVSTETVETPEPLETRAERQRRLGAQSTTPTDEADASLAAQLLEGATGTGLIHQPQRSGRGIFTR